MALQQVLRNNPDLDLCGSTLEDDTVQTVLCIPRFPHPYVSPSGHRPDTGTDLGVQFFLCGPVATLTDQCCRSMQDYYEEAKPLETKEWPGPEYTLTCPVCDHQHVPGATVFLTLEYMILQGGNRTIQKLWCHRCAVDFLDPCFSRTPPLEQDRISRPWQSEIQGDYWRLLWPVNGLIDLIMDAVARQRHLILGGRRFRDENGNNSVVPRSSILTRQKFCSKCHCDELADADGEVVKSMMQCSNCKAASYCSKACQKADWKDHKKSCARLKEIVIHAEKELKQQTKDVLRNKDLVRVRKGSY
jgi:hypothetical protein